ncbi:uncharacterized protein LOC129938888 isoform X1 [Eupeodes corollae]|uniref:uncharacterized protein LOC129938888 isoform X1 n=1 Tax=Eupeodes corollae TaxID=290404 RepID=UPI002493245E|nr:uncharacterized protein LOC129938888 isoform X1 [Eupeodes corollae]
MQRTIAVIIFNEESDNRDKLEVITNTFYSLNMTLKVLVNKTAKEIKDAVEKLTTIDEEDILDIIFFIYAKQANNSNTKFSTVDRKTMDLYDNIINYLLEVEDFEDKQKIIIFNINGHDNKSDLKAYDPEKQFKCAFYGVYTYILMSDSENFIDLIFPELVDHRNLSRALRKHKKIHAEETRSFSGDVRLSVPPSSTELTSEFHEFVIG